MPKRTDIKTILIIGSGPIVIGQACEFDYSGVQACNALKEDGYRVVLINSNPATIMTDMQIADVTYIEPLTIDYIERIIKKEKIDALLPTMGGQTSLNLAMELHRSGFLKKMGVIIIGARPDTIEKAENRFEFSKLMQEHGLSCPKGFEVSNIEEAKDVLKNLSLPVIIRSSFTLGGEGSGFAHTLEEFENVVMQALASSPIHQAFVEESVFGWKEFELEVMRDCLDNCVIVCSIENIDPMGVHTGDSITVAPALTLTDKEYQLMRGAAFKVMRVIGVETGGANVQFAIHPKTGRMVIIEMNPRVSRSSALASKATGFPIAKIAAKLAVGYTLDEIPNDITQKNSAAFEPSIDYVVTKIPRFDFEKFRDITPVLGTSMQSIGEVMAIGRTFKESFQKAIRSLAKDLSGFEEIAFSTNDLRERKKIIEEGLKIPLPERYLYVAEAYRHGLSEETIYSLCQWDPWFLRQIQELISFEEKIKEQVSDLEPNFLRHMKTLGFSNSRLSYLSGLSVENIQQKQKEYNIKPIYRRVDTCAAEFFSSTNYFYSTFLPYSTSEEACEVNPSNRQKVIILGSGPNHIGQGIEFDYCCVQASSAAQFLDYEVIMINCNPETVSTDHTTSDRLYFSPLTDEDVLNIIEKESQNGVVVGVFVQFGGQTALKLAHTLHNAGIKILGTSLASIDIAEDRQHCRRLIVEEGFLQPINDIATTPEELLNRAQVIGFPVILRPSYVIGGKFMEVISSLKELQESRLLARFNELQPILIEEFLEEALEVEVDAIADGEEIYIAGITEQFEKAGIHSGDSTSVLPSQTLSEDVLKQLQIHTTQIAQKLQIKGFINIQFALKGRNIYILEINPRASRTIPFISKATHIPLVFIAAQVMLGISLKSFKLDKNFSINGVAVKKSIFSFSRILGVDPSLGPEMKSTGEIMIHGIDFADASLKLHGTEYHLCKRPQKKILIFSDENSCKLSLNVISELKSLELDFEIKSNIFLKENTTFINAKFMKDAIQDILSNTVKFVINLSDGKIDQAELRKALLKTRTPEFKTFLEIKHLIRSLLNTKMQPSIISLQQKQKKGYDLEELNFAT